MFPRVPLCHLPRLLVGFLLLYLAWGWVRGRGHRYTSGLRPEELQPSEQVNQLPKFDFHKVRLESEEEDEVVEEEGDVGVDIDVNQEWEWTDGEDGEAVVLDSYSDFNEEVKAPHRKIVSTNPSPVPNNTARAHNQDVVFFNRVPKTGSQMMQELGISLARSLGFTAYIDPTPLTFFTTEKEDDRFAGNFRRRVESPGMYFRHMPWINMTASATSRPVWVSMVRNPLDRVISWFYYARWKDRPDDDNEEDCNKTDEMNKFCKTFNNIRSLEKIHPESWYQQDFDTCFLKKMKECVFKAGQGGWEDWTSGYDIRTGDKRYRPENPLSLYQDYRSQVMFFCGNHPDCIEFNSAKALNIAKNVVDEEYAVVGVLEDMSSTLEVLQAFVPRFFRNSTSLYRAMKEDTRMKNQNPSKKPVSDMVRNLMKDMFSNEIEFYEFCQQRLNQQLQQTSNSQQENYLWPHQQPLAVKDYEKFILL